VDLTLCFRWISTISTTNHFYSHANDNERANVFSHELAPQLRFSEEESMILQQITLSEEGGIFLEKPGLGWAGLYILLRGGLQKQGGWLA